MTSGGDLLVEALRRQGVDTVFGIPGVQLDAATDALGKQDAIRFIGVRNEQAATYMADGYARSTGRVGVAMVVPGPGVLNALAGLATAYATNSPLLLLAGQIDTHAIGLGLGALHEIPDQSGALAGLTKWSAMATAADAVPALVGTAFEQLRGGRTRPVALELPPNVLAASSSAAVPERAERTRLQPSDRDVSVIAGLLRAAERPLIYVGGGVIAADAAPELRELAELLEAPVLMSENGRGAIDARHRLAFDSLALRKFREQADLVLVVGSRFVTTFGTAVSTGDAQVVLVNAEEADLHGPRQAQARAHADAKSMLAALVGELAGITRPQRNAELAAVRSWLDSTLAQLAPQREYLTAIRGALPDDGVFVSEFTQVGYAASMCYPAYQPRTYIGAGYQGTLGAGFATALGVQAADLDRAVVSVNGDGGFSWTMQELSTAKRYNLPLVSIVFRDGFYGNVRRIQKTNYGARYFASDLTNPNYRTLADAFGIASATARNAAELGGVLVDAVAAREPILIDVPVGEFPSPWHLIHEGLPEPTPLPEGAHLATADQLLD